MEYYNDNDPGAAAWLRAAVAAGALPAGRVDERSIEDVTPEDLAGHTRVHLFAGIGGWPLALDLAGVPADQPVWTMSCPCQPFSNAGRGGGAGDARHLWPVAFRLVRECRPAIIYGEQVASRLGRLWFAAVRADLETLGYAVAGADLCAAGIGAPHIRQRLYWVAYAPGIGSRPGLRDRRPAGQWRDFPTYGRGALRMGDADNLRSPRGSASGECEGMGDQGAQPAGTGADVGLVYAEQPGPQGHAGHEHRHGQHPDRADPQGPVAAAGVRIGPEWVACRDGKHRPVEPGVAPLAHGVPGRVVLLRGYGNGIHPKVGAAWIRGTW